MNCGFSSDTPWIDCPGRISVSGIQRQDKQCRHEQSQSTDETGGRFHLDLRMERIML